MPATLHSIEQKLKSKLPTSTEDKQRLNHACDTVVSGLQLTLNIVREATGNIGVPGLQAGISSLLFVVDVIKKTSQNALDIEQLAKRIDNLTTVLRNSKNAGTLSKAIIDRIDHLATNWSTVADDVRKVASRHVVKRLIHYNDDAQVISGHIQTITWSIESFTVETMLAIEFTLDEHVHFVKHAATRIEGKLDNVGEKLDVGFQQVNAKLDVKDGRPPHAVLARFDCKERASCLEGTRLDVLDCIYRWIDIEDSRVQDTVDQMGSSGDANVTDATTENSQIFWINGSAGTGKTTIAFTIAETCRKRGILGASFFCSRDDAECSNPNLIFSTIAYQLGQFFPLFNAEITRALKSNPDIGYSSVSYQLEELIVKPLRAVRSYFPPCVIVLDALDECKDSGATSIILSSLSRYVAELSPLKILLTSRPERNITKTFKSNELSPATQRLILHEIALGVVHNDIKRYLATKLALIRDSYELECAWPSEVDIQALAHLSFGLFIFAATSVKYIDDRYYSDPRSQLTDILRNRATVANSWSSTHYHLDQLYTQVLTHAFPDMSISLAGRLKMVIGTVVLLRNPLSPLALEALLNMRANSVRETLVHLHSVVIVPEDDIRVIRLLHPSFFDFITNPTRCPNPTFLVDVKTQHTLLARACLGAMKELRRDICGIKNPSILNNEVENLSTKIVQHIPPHLQYACRNWAFHLAHGMVSDVVLEAVKEFGSKYLLYWVEVCSLLGELRNAILALDAAQQALVNRGKDTTDINGLLHNGERFVCEFFQVLSTSSLQVYHSALLFAPKQTSLHEMYQHELVLPMKVHNASEKTWNTCMRIMEGHSGAVLVAAFSIDGTQIASGSYDHTLRLWDAISGAHLNTLMGHSEAVLSVAFSPDGKRVVSGSSDNTLRLWNTASGEHINTLTGHSSLIWSVAFSPDGTRIVSGSDDKSLRLWNASSGEHLRMLTGHSDTVHSVAFSPDGTRIVSGSWDNTLRLWDTVSGAHLNTLIGHSETVNSVAFSPDGTRIVSGSFDGTLRFWDAVSGVHLRTLTGHSDAVHSVAFSPDGTQLVSGSSDDTLRLWDAVSGEHLNTLIGHSDHIWSVAFSPDSRRVLSGSDDKSLRLWNAVSGAHLHTLMGHSTRVRLAVVSSGTGILSRLLNAVTDVHRNAFTEYPSPVCSIAFSPDGMWVVSGSDDHTLRLWDAVSGAHLNTFMGHSAAVLFVAFSPDGKRVVSGSDDGTLRLWDAARGECLNILAGHSHPILSVAFSPDGMRIVSGSEDSSLRLWNAVSGAHLHTLTGHNWWVHSVAFSPDGTRVVSGSGDNTLRLWDAISGAHLNTLKRIFGLHSVAFSPDGTRIVSASDGALQLWDAISGAHLGTFMGHYKSTLFLAFSPDNMLLVCGCVNYQPDTTANMYFDTFAGSVTSVAYALDLSQCSGRLRLKEGDRFVVTPICGYVIEDGWIISLPQKRRLCWLPVSCRPRRLSWSGNRIALGTNDGRVVILDFTDMDSYLDAL